VGQHHSRLGRHFLVDHHLVGTPSTTADEVRAAARFRWLTVEVTTGTSPT
jgi:hypothetical protein